MFDRVESVRKDDPPVAKASLEDRPVVFSGPSSCNTGMVGTELQKIAKQRHAWNLWKAFNLWLVGRVEIPNQEVAQREEKEGKSGRRKCQGLQHDDGS